MHGVSENTFRERRNRHGSAVWDERVHYGDVDVWPPVIGVGLRDVVHGDLDSIVSPGVVILTSRNNVGEMKVRDAVMRSKALVTWLYVIRQGDVPGSHRRGIPVHLSEAYEETLTLPHGLYVGRDGNIWRRSFVGALPAWEGFYESAIDAFSCGV